MDETMSIDLSRSSEKSVCVVVKNDFGDKAYVFIGKGRGLSPHAYKKRNGVKQNDDFNMMLKEFPEMKNRQLPPEGGLAELISLRSHRRLIRQYNFKETDVTEYERTPENTRIIVDVKSIDTSTVAEYVAVEKTRVRRPYHMEKFDVQDVANIVIDCMSGVLTEPPPTSSPGYPWGLVHSSNREFLSEESGRLVRDIVLFRLGKIFEFTRNPDWFLDYDPERAFLDGLADPIRIFTKNESHSENKMKLKRYRLIWSLSVIDQIVGKVAHKQLDLSIINNWMNCKMQSGMSFPQDAPMFIDIIRQWNTVADTDNQFWDWTVTMTTLFTDGLRRCAHLGYKLDNGEPVMTNIMRIAKTGTFHMKLIIFLITARAQCVAVLSTGELIRCNIMGAMKSGQDNTSSSNGAMRNMLTYQVCKDIGVTRPPCVFESFSNGDDQICQWNESWKSEDFIKQNKEYGSIIKQMNVASVGKNEYFELNSHAWYLDTKTVKYINMEKALHQLFTTTEITMDHYISAKVTLGPICDRLSCFQKFQKL